MAGTSHTSRAPVAGDIDESYLHKNHWDSGWDIIITAPGAAGEKPLGAPVQTGMARRIREVTVRHAGTNNTVVTIWNSPGGMMIISLDVPAQTTRTWSSQDGRSVPSGWQPVIQSSDVTGGNTIVSAAGLEA